MKRIENDYSIERISEPAKFFAAHNDTLSTVGADAFGQPIAEFASQVAERFNKAEIAQIMRHGQQIVGFALYDVLRGSHWRLAFD